MTKLIMLVGISGSGKSAYAKALKDNYYTYEKCIIIESDKYRETLYGSAEIQGDNNKLFDTIHKDIIANLQANVSVIFDATNVSYKNRITLLQKLNNLNIKKICYVVATQYNVCLERNSKRDRKVPDYIINRQWKNFTVPQYEEGFDEINFIFDYNELDYEIEDYLNKAMSFEQDNPYHTGTLGEHTLSVASNILDKTDKHDLWYAAVLHDNGKRYTKTFKNSKGEPSEIAHYFSHENVGSYETMFYLNNLGLAVNRIVYICGLIQYHMRPYGAETEKAKEKLKNLVGNKMYEDLMLLNEADKNGK